MNDKVPGRALDELFEPDVSKGYFELAIKVAEHHGLLMLRTGLEICHASRQTWKGGVLAGASIWFCSNASSSGGLLASGYSLNDTGMLTDYFPAGLNTPTFL